MVLQLEVTEEVHGVLFPELTANPLESRNIGNCSLYRLYAELGVIVPESVQSVPLWTRRYDPVEKFLFPDVSPMQSGS